MTHTKYACPLVFNDPQAKTSIPTDGTLPRKSSTPRPGAGLSHNKRDPRPWWRKVAACHTTYTLTTGSLGAWSLTRSRSPTPCNLPSNFTQTFDAIHRGGISSTYGNDSWTSSPTLYLSALYTLLNFNRLLSIPTEFISLPCSRTVFLRQSHNLVPVTGKQDTTRHDGSR